MEPTTTQAVRLDGGRVLLDVAARRLAVGGATVKLGGRAFDVFAALVQHHDRVVTKQELLGLVWHGVVVEENTLQVHIAALRRALGAQAVATVWGRGYRCTLPIEAVGCRC
jgi:DNA-binding winged helix-turn-helix (wHTH) protein